MFKPSVQIYTYNRLHRSKCGLIQKEPFARPGFTAALHLVTPDAGRSPTANSPPRDHNVVKEIGEKNFEN